jgi:hypothetical protein
MKRLSNFINESIGGAKIKNTHFRTLLGWVALAGSWGKQNRLSYNAQYKACPKVNDFGDTISSAEIDTIDKLMYRLQDAIEHSERSITIDRKTKNLIIWLAKYAWDNAFTITNDVNDLKLIQFSLASQ